MRFEAVSGCRGLFLLERMVGGTHQRPRLDVAQPHAFSQHLVLGKFVGVHVPDHGQVLARRLQVLAQRKNVGSLFRQLRQLICQMILLRRAL